MVMTMLICTAFRNPTGSVKEIGFSALDNEKENHNDGETREMFFELGFQDRESQIVSQIFKGDKGCHKQHLEDFILDGERFC